MIEKMKKIIITLSLMISSLLSTQLDAQSINYTYVRNDPFDIRNFSASIDALWGEVNAHNGYAFGWGARAEYMMGKTLLFNFDSRFGFGTNLYRESNGNTANYFAMEGGVGLIFVNKAHVRNVPIVLSTQRVGNYQYTTYIRGGVPAKVRTIVALRGGWGQYRNTLNFTKFSDSLLTFNDSTYVNAKDKMKIFEYKSDTTKSAPTLSIDQYGTINIGYLYGGLNFRTIRNLLIDVEGYGYRGNILYSDFYIDVMFAPIFNLKDFSVLDARGERTYKVGYKEISRFGWRIGWFWRKPKEQGFSWKFEFGSRPGFKSMANSSLPVNVRNLYCMMTAGLYIPLKIKPIYTED